MKDIKISPLAIVSGILGWFILGLFSGIILSEEKKELKASAVHTVNDHIHHDHIELKKDQK